MFFKIIDNIVQEIHQGKKNSADFNIQYPVSDQLSKRLQGWVTMTQLPIDLQKSVAKWVAKTAFGGRFIDRRKHGGTLLQKSINSVGCVVVYADLGPETVRGRRTGPPVNWMAPALRPR